MDQRAAVPVPRRGLGRWGAVLALVATLAPGPLAGVGSLPASAAEDSLGQSREGLRRFPFRPDCAGNTREMVACLWERRNQGDASLAKLLGRPELLERWRASRRLVCRQAAEKAKGGSIHPIVWLSCENGLNKELLRQIRRPLLESADL
jgi:hypothetical protein